jgi:hypothetical protein
LNLREVILAGSTIDENLVLFAKRIDGKLLPTSEVVLVEFTEEERDMEMDMTDAASRKCPGFTYCMEMFLIQDMLNDLKGQEFDLDRKVERVIYYIEHDA